MWGLGFDFLISKSGFRERSGLGRLILHDQLTNA